MLYADVQQKLRDIEEIRAVLTSGLPQQEEAVALSTIRWKAKLTPTDADFEIKVASNVTIDQMPLQLVERYIEVRRALQAWKNSGGPWPLAR